MTRTWFLSAAVLAALTSALPACKGNGPSGPSAPTTLQVYKNGSVGGWGGNFLADTTTANGMTDNLSAAVTDSLTGDVKGLELLQTNATGGPVTSRFGFWAIDTGSAPAPQNMSAFYASGHLQFDLKLAMPPGAGGVSALGLVGTSDGGSATFALTPADYNTTSFTHVSAPISSVYPPASSGAFVSGAFSLFYVEVPNGSNQPVLYLDDIKWTNN